MNACVIIIQILFVLKIVAITSFEPYIDQEKSSLSSVLFKIIKDFYVKQSNTIFVSQCSDNRLNEIHYTILQNVLATFDLDVLVTWIVNGHEDSAINRVNNIIFVDSYETFRLISQNITTKLFGPYGYYTVILTKFYEDDYAIISKILQDCWKNDVINVNIVTKISGTGTVLLYTYFPFTPSHCGKVVPVIWNYFERGHFLDRNKDIFPRKTQDIGQCPISILVAVLKPYIYVSQSYSNNTYDLSGPEYTLILTLAERMKFKPLFLIHFDTNVGEVFENGTGTLALGEVAQRNVNMTVGAFLETTFGRAALIGTKSYSWDDLILVVPYSSAYNSFEKLFFPFTLGTWIFITAILIIALTVIKLLKNSNVRYYELIVGSDKISPYFNLIHVFITGKALKEPRKSFARFLVMLLIIALLVLQTGYQAQLFRFIKTNKTKKSYQTIEELIEHNIAIKLIKENYHMFLNFDKRIEKLLKFVDSNSTWEYVTENEAYITLENQLVDETRRKTYENSEFEKPKTIKLSTLFHVLYLPKHSYLKLTLDDEITYMNENGLTEKWNAPYKEAAIFNPNDHKIPRKLNISQLFGIIEICLGLFALGIIVFILEILSTYSLIGKTIATQSMESI